MSNTSPSLSLVSRQIRVDFVLVGCLVTLGCNWRERIFSYVDPLLKEESYSHMVEFVGYSQLHPDLLADPVYSMLEHDEEGNIVKDRVMKGVTPDDAAFRGYMSVFEMIDYIKRRNPYTEFNFYLRHIAAGQHDYCDSDWDLVRRGLIDRDVNLSTVLFDDCPIFAQLSSDISFARLYIAPLFPTSSGQRFPLSGFIPPGELGGAVPSVVSAAHPAPSISVPSAIGATAWDFAFKLPDHVPRYTDDLSPFSQHAGSESPDDYAQDPAMVPFFEPYEDPQAFNSAAMQSQSHLNPGSILVPEAEGLAPMHCSAPPPGSGVEQHPTPHDHLGHVDSPDDFENENARPALSDKMSDIELKRTLNLNGTRIPVQAQMASKIGDPKLSDLPNEWKVELATGRKLSFLDIQGWIHKFKISMVQLSYINGMDNCDFDKLVEKIRAHGYAIVMWENRDRILLAPLGKFLLCAVFPEEGTTKRPTPQPPLKIRTLPKKEGPQIYKKQSPDKGLGHTPRKRRSPSTVRVTNKPPGLQRRVRRRPRSKQPQVLNSQDSSAIKFMQFEIDLSGQWHQMGSRNGR